MKLPIEYAKRTSCLQSMDTNELNMKGADNEMQVRTGARVRGNDVYDDGKESMPGV